MCAKVHHTLQLTLVLLIGCGGARSLRATETEAGGLLTNAIAQAEADLVAARHRSHNATTNSVAAWELGRACFTWGKLLKTPEAKEKIFTEGIAACRQSLTFDPQSAPAHYYLGMNIGRVADLKRNLAAFGMVKEMERAFLQAAKLDEKFAFGGPDRNLGLLHHEAPGWPLSVGNQKSARKHLERAVKLAPGYPENRLNLAEGYWEWQEKKLFQQQLAALQTLWPIAKTNFTGVEWEPDWADWESRREKLLRATTAK